MTTLQGRTALVTGGSRGIGLGIAERLTADGARVIVSGRNAERLLAVAEERGWTAIVADLATREGLAHLIEQVLEAGPVDVLINNAGIAPGSPLKRTPDALWDEVMQLNVHSVFALCRALMPPMAERGWGRVVNMSSIAGLTGQAYTSVYCASKHAVIGLTRALAMEFARYPVTVNAVCPGWVETDMAREAAERIAQTTGRSDDEARKTLEGASPQRRLVQVEEVANLVSMLCGEGARGILGQAIPVDGGTIMK